MNSLPRLTKHSEFDDHSPEPTEAVQGRAQRDYTSTWNEGGGGTRAVYFTLFSLGVSPTPFFRGGGAATFKFWQIMKCVEYSACMYTTVYFQRSVNFLRVVR